MKLKKIASLALAGVMAVSMLAGCKGGSTVVDGNGNANVPSIVTAVNNGQSSWNEVKINFTSDSALDAAVDKAFEMYGDNTGSNSQREAIIQYTGMVGAENNLNAFYDSDTNKPTSNDDGETVTFLQTYYLGSAPASDEYIMNRAAATVDNIVGGLENTTLVTEDEATAAKPATKDNEKYYNFDYTGKVAAISFEFSNGSTGYYMVLVIEQTVTEKTLEK